MGGEDYGSGCLLTLILLSLLVPIGMLVFFLLNGIEAVLR